MIVLLAAMNEELEAMVNQLEHTTTKQTPFGMLVEGSLENQSVVLAQTGVGKTMAAATTTYLLERYEVSAIINIGSAGGLSNELSIGDVIIANKVSYHDWDLRAFNYPTGWENTQMVFEMDKHIVSVAKEATKLAGLHAWVGPIVSGDQFVCETDQFNKIVHEFPKVLAVEMEAAAIAHVASRYKVPTAILRSISDVVFDENSHIDFDTFIKKAAAQSAAAVVSTIRLMANQ